jgi:hypothetical protein
MCFCAQVSTSRVRKEHGRVEMVHQGAGGANADAFCEGMQTLAGARTKQRLLRTVDNCSTGFDK